jgi:hypothetical protein
MNFNRIFCNFILCIGIFGLGFQGFFDVNSQIRLFNSNINKLILKDNKFLSLMTLQQFTEKIILFMNASLIVSALMFMINITSMGYSFYHMTLIIQFLFLNNPYIVNTSKVYLVLSAYFGIYGGLLCLNS